MVKGFVEKNMIFFVLENLKQLRSKSRTTNDFYILLHKWRFTRGVKIQKSTLAQ